MYNVKITPVTNGYQFSSDIYPDTGCAETIIAANVKERQRLSVLPHKAASPVGDIWLDHV